MPENPARSSKQLLDPIELISEILFGLIMVLTFTGSLSAVTAGREDVRTMLLGAIGCNLAWGLIDAVMYVIARFVERARNILTVRAVRESADPGKAQHVIAGALPPLLASVLSPAQLEAMRRQLKELPEPPTRPYFAGDDFRGAIVVFLLVFLSTFPVVIPFIFINNAMMAVRVSNGIAIILLFLCGYRLGHYAGHRPWRMGLSMAVIGSALVGITMALGG